MEGHAIKIPFPQHIGQRFPLQNPLYRLLKSITLPLPHIMLAVGENLLRGNAGYVANKISGVHAGGLGVLLGQQSLPHFRIQLG